MSSSFIATSSLAGTVQISTGGTKPLIEDAGRILALLRDRAPGVAPLFASPLLARPTPGSDGAANVSWYGIHDSAARRLSEAQPAQREQCLNSLRQVLLQVLTLRDDPELGPLLPGLLTIPSADSVMVVGSHPVLINWGIAPAGTDVSAEALQARFDGILGALCGISWPAPAPEVMMPETAMPVAAALPPVAEPQTSTPLPMTAAAVTGAAVTGAAAAPWYARRGTLIGLAVLLILLILALVWWLLWAPGGLLARPAPVVDLHGPVLEGLRHERDRLRGLDGQSCPALLDGIREGYSGPLSPHAAPLDRSTPGGVPPLGGAPTLDGAPTQAEPLPPPPDLTNLPASPAARMTVLARSLEYSTAMVLGESRQGMALGTAFFVTPDTLVTNRHVVDDIPAGAPLVVTSQALGNMRPVSVIARTRTHDIGGPDFALLRLAAPEPKAIPLTVGTRVDKLARVITSGFPGYIAQSDTAFRDLAEGTGTAAPSMVFTSGEVSVVQRQANGTTIVIHTADMSQGNSGGPLVDLCGRAVGVNTFIGVDGTSGRRGLYALGGADLTAFLAGNGIAASQSDEVCAEEGAAPEDATQPAAGGTQ